MDHKKLKSKLPSPVKRAIKQALVAASTSMPSRVINGMRLRAAVAAADSPKLHLGCSTRLLSGWINIDVLPSLPPADIFLDLTKPLPLAEGTVDYIFTEDLIEHLDLQSGHQLLSECFRVLKKAGCLRVGTPDLQSFAKAYLERSESDLSWYRKECGVTTYAEMFNAGMRNWGHQFLYDEETMTKTLTEIGFETKKSLFNQSEHVAFSGLDLRNPEEGAHSMYFDCRKPI